MTELKLFKTGPASDVTMCYVDDKTVCDVCGQIINDHLGAFVVDWTREGRKDTLMHDRCVNDFKYHPLSVSQFRWSVLMTETIPPKSVPVFIQPPALSSSRSELSVFEPDKIRSDTTKDDAWRSKRYESLEGVTIGSPDVLDRIEERDNKDQVLLDADPDSFLKELLSSSKKAVIEHKARDARLLDAPELDEEDVL